MKNIQLDIIGIVTNDRKEIGDDNWGDVISTIVLNKEIYSPDATLGLETFSHVEVIFHMNKVPDNKIVNGARHPRNNKEWPLTGILAQRGKNRINKLGLSRAEIISVDGLEIQVKGLDAIDQTPVLDIKPFMQEFVPDNENTKQPNWSHELMKRYFY